MHHNLLLTGTSFDTGNQSNKLDTITRQVRDKIWEMGKHINTMSDDHYVKQGIDTTVFTVPKSSNPHFN